MGFSDKKNREASIQQHLMFLNEQYNVLTSICEEAENIKISEENQDILNYQFISALYGKELVRNCRKITHASWLVYFSDCTGQKASM